MVFVSSTREYDFQNITTIIIVLTVSLFFILLFAKEVYKYCMTRGAHRVTSMAWYSDLHAHMDMYIGFMIIILFQLAPLTQYVVFKTVFPINRIVNLVRFSLIIYFTTYLFSISLIRETSGLYDQFGDGCATIGRRTKYIHTVIIISLLLIGSTMTMIIIDFMFESRYTATVILFVISCGFFILIYFINNIQYTALVAHAADESETSGKQRIRFIRRYLCTRWSGFLLLLTLISLLVIEYFLQPTEPNEESSIIFDTSVHSMYESVRFSIVFIQLLSLINLRFTMLYFYPFGKRPQLASKTKPILQPSSNHKNSTQQHFSISDDESDTIITDIPRPGDDDDYDNDNEDEKYTNENDTILRQNK
jgi:hypothetical protein